MAGVPVDLSRITHAGVRPRLARGPHRAVALGVPARRRWSAATSRSCSARRGTSRASINPPQPPRRNYWINDLAHRRRRTTGSRARNRCRAAGGRTGTRGSRGSAAPRRAAPQACRQRAISAARAGARDATCGNEVARPSRNAPSAVRGNRVDRVGDDRVHAPLAELGDARRIVRACSSTRDSRGGARSRRSRASRQLVVGVERDAPEAREAVEPVGGQLVEQQRARQRRAPRRARASSDTSENDDSSGGTSASRHSAAASSATARAGLALAAGRRLDLALQNDAVRARPARDRRERRQHLARVLRRMPAAGVEPRQLAPRQRIGAAAAAGRALERRVVQQERDVVGGELHVELDHRVAVRVADAHRRQRVLGRELAGAAVRAQARIGPVRAAAFIRQPRAGARRRTGTRAPGRREVQRRRRRRGVRAVRQRAR